MNINLKNNLLASIVITTYNRSDIVGKTIQSVLDQDYPNFEIIVVDDCSTDSTEEYFKNNFVGKIKYVRHKVNKGVQFASNTGFKYSTGKYLAFTGDDDIWSDKNKLKKQVEIFENDKEKKYGTVTTSIKVVRPNKTFSKIIKKPRNLVKHILSHNGIIYGSAALIRREAFERAGKFAEKLLKGTDSDVHRRIILLGYDVYFIQKPMIDYYEGHEQMTSVNEKSIIRSIKAENYKLKNYEYYYKIYPSSKADVLASIGNNYIELSKLKNKNQNIKLARGFLRQGIIIYPLNTKLYYKLLKTELKFLKP